MLCARKEKASCMRSQELHIFVIICINAYLFCVVQRLPSFLDTIFTFAWQSRVCVCVRERAHLAIIHDDAVVYNTTPKQPNRQIYKSIYRRMGFAAHGSLSLSLFLFLLANCFFFYFYFLYFLSFIIILLFVVYSLELYISICTARTQTTFQQVRHIRNCMLMFHVRGASIVCTDIVLQRREEKCLICGQRQCQESIESRGDGQRTNQKPLRVDCMHSAAAML